jgi:hypothetical protein
LRISRAVPSLGSPFVGVGQLGHFSTRPPVRSSPPARQSGNASDQAVITAVPSARRVTRLREPVCNKAAAAEVKPSGRRPPSSPRDPMNHHHTARLTRSLTHTPSRRDVLRGLAGSGLSLSVFRLEAAEGKHKRHKQRKKKKKTQIPSPPATPCTPRCRRKVCGDDGCGGSCGSCAAVQFCASGTCCTPDPVEETCLVNCDFFQHCPLRCDTVRLPGTCGQDVACSCPSGQECLSNGTCGKVCTVNSDCGGGVSICGNCDPSTEGVKSCNAGSDCSEQMCTSTAECPLGTHCQVVSSCPGGTQNRCVPLTICTS